MLKGGSLGLRTGVIVAALLSIWLAATVVAFFPYFVGVGQLVEAVPLPYRVGAIVTLTSAAVLAVGKAFHQHVVTMLFRRGQKLVGVTRGLLSIKAGTIAAGLREAIARGAGLSYPRPALDLLRRGVVELRCEPDNKIGRAAMRRRFLAFTGPYLSVEVGVKAAQATFAAAEAQRRFEESRVKAAYDHARALLPQVDLVFGVLGFRPGKTGLSTFTVYPWLMDHCTMPFLVVVISRACAQRPQDLRQPQRTARPSPTPDAIGPEDAAATTPDPQPPVVCHLTFHRPPLPPRQPSYTPGQGEDEQEMDDWDRMTHALASIFRRVGGRGYVVLVENPNEDDATRCRINQHLLRFQDILAWTLLNGADPWQALSIGAMPTTITPPILVVGDILEEVDRLNRGPVSTLLEHVPLTPRPAEDARRRMIFWGMGHSEKLAALEEEVQRIYRPWAFFARMAELPGVEWALYTLQVELADEEVEHAVPGITSTRPWQAYCRALSGAGTRHAGGSPQGSNG
jgi:hypothetical protein